MTSNPVYHGFSLVEVTLSLGLIAFCLLALVGLLPMALKSNQTAAEQTAAAGLASEIIADLRVAPASGTSPRFGFVIPGPGGGASGSAPQTLSFAEDYGQVGTIGSPVSTTADRTPRYLTSVGFAPPGGGQKGATFVHVLVTWPALGNQPNAWPTNYAGAFETVTTLDRN